MDQPTEIRILELEQLLDLSRSNAAQLSANYDALSAQKAELETRVSMLRNEVARLTAAQQPSLESLIIQALGSQTVDNIICNYIDKRASEWLVDHDMLKNLDDKIYDAVRGGVECAIEQYDMSDEVDDAVRNAVQEALESVEIRVNGRRY